MVFSNWLMVLVGLKRETLKAPRDESKEALSPMGALSATISEVIG
jgi:hypothetical protein